MPTSSPEPADRGAATVAVPATAGGAHRRAGAR
jgi:hypothetical protein